MTERCIRICLIDDHEMVREGLKRMLANYHDLAIVGEAGTATEAVEAVRTTAADVVLLDLQLPDGQGLDVLPDLLALPHPPAVLVLTVHDDHDLVLGAARRGARGYVLKHTSHEELATAVRRVAAGGHYFSPDVVGTLVQGELNAQDRLRLTTRELEVLRLLVEGLPNRGIGRRLFLSGDTVKTHLGNIYRKLGVDGRTQAVVVALRDKLLE